MQALRNVFAASLILAGLGFAQAQTPDSVGQAATRPIERVSVSLERESPYRKAVRAHYSEEVGFGAGLSTGNGISYRHWFSDAWGVQLNVLPYYSETKYPNRSANDYPTRDSGFLHDGYFSA